MVFVAASVVCALASNSGVMMAARLVQGFAGGWAMVIGRAVIVDLATGARQVLSQRRYVGYLLGAIWFGTPLLLAILCFFVLMTAQGLIVANAGALAAAEVPDHPGTGSAVLGFVQWVAAGTIAPVAGLGGRHRRPTALLVIIGTAVSIGGLLVAARSRRHRA